MNVEEKVNALQADVAQWNKAKNRIHYALPKVREFIHLRHLGPGTVGTEEAGGTFQEPRRAAGPDFRVGSSLGTARRLAERATDFGLSGQHGRPGMPKHLRGDPEGIQHTGEECGRQGPQKAGRQAGKVREGLERCAGGWSSSRAGDPFDPFRLFLDL